MSQTMIPPQTAPSGDLERIAWAVTGLRIETPSWGYANSGTRFKVFPQPGVPRDAFEKVEDAATVGRFTGVAKSIALHIPWDSVDDFGALTAFAREARRRASAASTPIPSRTRTTSWAPCATRRCRSAQRRSSTSSECCDIARADRLEGRQGLAGRRHQLPGPGRLPRPTQAPHRRLEGDLSGASRERPPVPRVQAVRAGLLSHRRPGLGPGADGLPARGRARPGLRRHRPSRDGRQHRADRRLPAPGGPPGRLRPERQEVRRRRPDGRQHRPVPALPHLP